jgi:hypothetical protein
MADLLLYAAETLGGFSKADMVEVFETYPRHKVGDHLVIRGAWLCLTGTVWLEFGMHELAHVVSQSPGMPLSLLMRLVQSERGRRTLSNSSVREEVREEQIGVVPCWDKQLEQAFVEGDMRAARWLAKWQQYQVVRTAYGYHKSFFPSEDVELRFDCDKMAWHVLTSSSSSSSCGSGVSSKGNSYKKCVVSLDNLAEKLQMPPELYRRLMEPLEEEQYNYLQHLLRVAGKMQERVEQWEVWVGKVLQLEQWEWEEGMAAAVGRMLEEVLSPVAAGTSTGDDKGSGVAETGSSDDTGGGGGVAGSNDAIGTGSVTNNRESNVSSSSTGGSTTGNSGCAAHGGTDGESVGGSSSASDGMFVKEAPLVMGWAMNLHYVLHDAKQFFTALKVSAAWLAGACKVFPSCRSGVSHDEWLLHEPFFPSSLSPAAFETAGPRQKQQQRQHQETQQEGREQLPDGEPIGKRSTAGATAPCAIDLSKSCQQGDGLNTGASSSSTSSLDTRPLRDQQKVAGQCRDSADSYLKMVTNSELSIPKWQHMLCQHLGDAFDCFRHLDTAIFEPDHIWEIPLPGGGVEGFVYRLRLLGEWKPQMGALLHSVEIAAPATAVAAEAAKAAAGAAGSLGIAEAAAANRAARVFTAVLFLKKVEGLLLSHLKLVMLGILSGMRGNLEDLAGQVERRLAELERKKEQQLRQSEHDQEQEEQPQQQEKGGGGDDPIVGPRGPLPLRQLLLLQIIPHWPTMSGPDAKGLVGAALLNKQFTFAEAAVAGNAAGDPNWWVAGIGVRDWPDLTLQPAMCFAWGRLMQMCVDLVREKQLGKEPIRGREEREEPDQGLQFLGVVPPFRWLSWRQQQVFQEKYQAEQHQMSQLELQLRYMPHLDHEVLGPRQMEEQQQQQGERVWSPGSELEVKKDVVQAVLQLLDMPGIAKDGLRQWIRKYVKAGATAADTAVLVQLLTAVGSAKKLPGGAWFERNGGLGEKLMCCPGAVDLFGAMTAWSARVCPYTF